MAASKKPAKAAEASPSADNQAASAAAVPGDAVETFGDAVADMVVLGARLQAMSASESAGFKVPMLPETRQALVDAANRALSRAVAAFTGEA